MGEGHYHALESQGYDINDFDALPEHYRQEIAKSWKEGLKQDIRDIPMSRGAVWGIVARVELKDVLSVQRVYPKMILYPQCK